MLKQHRSNGIKNNYGRHNRHFNRTSTARFDPIINSHNESTDYGLQYSDQLY